MAAEQKLTGYPSVDKPWLKYYSDEAGNTPYPECSIYDFILKQNQAHFSQNALDYYGKKVTYEELFNRVDETANALAEIGIEKGEVIPIISLNTPETIYTIFALNYIGAIPCLEYVTESESEAEKTIRECKAKTIFILDALFSDFAAVSDMDQIEHVVLLPVAESMPLRKRIPLAIKSLKKISHSKVIRYRDLFDGTANKHVQKAEYRKDTPAIIVHSGGTTGTPKGVILSNDNVNYVGWAFIVNQNDVMASDRFYASVPLFHAFGFVMCIVFPLVKGAELFLTIKYDEKAFVCNFLRIRPNHSMSSSTYMETWMNDIKIKKSDLSYYKTNGIGGTAITESTEKKLCEYLAEHNSCAKPSLGYGMSELSSAACTEINRYYGKMGSVGIPLLNVIVKAVDVESEEELKYDQEGELYIASPGLMVSYFNNEVETSSVIVTDSNGVRWIRTGDLGYVDSDGFVFITGKRKRIYTARAHENSAIFHIFPDYIANVVSEVNGIRECAVVCIEHPILKNIPVAFVTADSNEPGDEIPQKVTRHCIDVLPEQSVPKAVYCVDELPKNVIGKDDYKKMEQIALCRFFSNTIE